jgi:hypothetical protein
MRHRPSPEPFEGDQGTSFIHDRSSGLMIITARQGEAEVPIEDFWSYLDVVRTARGGAASLDDVVDEALELSHRVWPELLRTRRLQPSVYAVSTMLERARIAAYADAALAQRLAGFADFATDALLNRPGAGDWIPGLRARAQGIRAHALRLQGNLREAHVAFGLARSYAAGGDPDLDALEMLFYLDARDDGRAHARLTRALAGFLAQERFDRAALALVVRSALRVYAGDPATAAEDLLSAVHLLDPERHAAAAWAVDEALALVAPEQQADLARRMSDGVQRVDAEAPGPSYPDAVEAVAYVRRAVRRYVASRELLRAVATLGRPQRRTA